MLVGVSILPRRLCVQSEGRATPEGHEFAAFVGNQRDELEPEQRHVFLK